MATDYLTQLDPAEVASAIDGIKTGRPELIEAANGNARLALYLVLVDWHLRRAIGIGHRALPDRPWATLFAEGTCPEDAAAAALADHAHRN